jgi:hypothetical protein
MKGVEGGAGIEGPLVLEGGVEKGKVPNFKVGQKQSCRETS